MLFTRLLDTIFKQIFLFFYVSILQIFDANTDAVTEVTVLFPEPITARVVRITGEEKAHSNWQIRFEILGCKQEATAVARIHCNINE